MNTLKAILSLSLLAPALHAAAVTGIDGHTVSVKNPVRIVALNTSTVEILAELGEAHRIVGVDLTGLTILPERKDLANFGHPYRPNIEGIIATGPDLVITTADTFQYSSTDQLRSAGIPVLLLESSAQDGLEGLKRRITAIAALFDKQAEAVKLNEAIDRRLAALREKNASIEKKARVFFLYTHGPGHAVIYGRNTGSHWLIELAGGINAADFTEGTKPLTPEATVQAAPDVFILLERSLAAVKGPEGIRSLPGVSLTPAGRDLRIFSTDNNIRWIGPRFMDHVEKLHRELYPHAR